MVFVRWAGVLQWLIVAAILAHNQPLTPIKWMQRKPGLLPSRRLVLAAFLSGLVTFGVFVSVRQALKLTPDEAELPKEQGAVLDDSTQQPQAESKTVDLINTTKQPKNMPREYLRRFGDSGKWFSWLVWQPLRFVGGVNAAGVVGSIMAFGVLIAILYAWLWDTPRRFFLAAAIVTGLVALNWAANARGHVLVRPIGIDVLLGWIMIFAIALIAIQGIRQHQWIMLAAMLYAAALCLNWPNPNSRYLVPIAPLLIWGTVAGVQSFRPKVTRVWPWARPLLLYSFIATLIVTNLALLGIDAWIASSGDFYARYEGGLDKNLINICNYLRKQSLTDRDVAVNERYTNIGKMRYSKFGVRATVMLGDFVTQYVPQKYAGDPTSQKNFYNWARRHHVKYYLVQQPTSPWRVWHFRLSPRLAGSDHTRASCS